MKNIRLRITEIHYNKNAKGLFVKILEFCSIFYGIASRMKNKLYDKNILKPKKLNAFVISVGNMTTGGVGKTPVVCEIAKYLVKNGEKIAIISRGYGGKLSCKNINVISDGKNIFYNAVQAGDEPFWLAQNLRDVVVITSKDRFRAGKYAIEKFGVTKIILDDGFQHRKLHRDIDIVLTDSTKGFGNEKLLPAGPLREGKEGFSRIDRLVIVSKNIDHSKAEKLQKIFKKKMNVRTVLCRIEPDYIYNIKSGEILDKDIDVTAISGIGQPEQFYNFLKDYKVKQTITFDDHHIYTETEIPEGVIVTTEKDAVKMKNFNNIYALKLKVSVDIADLL